jgi:hypothetical protein
MDFYIDTIVSETKATSIFRAVVLEDSFSIFFKNIDKQLKDYTMQQFKRFSCSYIHITMKTSDPK